MQSGTFRKNVKRTLAVKSAKLGLRVVGKNSTQTNLVHSTVSLAVHMGKLMQCQTQYLLGLQTTQEMKDDAFTVMGDAAYDVAVLSSLLKVKLPASTKKSKLSGTRAAGLLHMNGLIVNLLGVVESGVFDGPPMKTVKKTVTMPNKGGAQEEREVQVVDAVGEEIAETGRRLEMVSQLSGVIDVFWRLSLDIFGQPPAVIFDAKIDQLKKQYAGVEFDLSEEVEEPAEQPA